MLFSTIWCCRPFFILNRTKSELWLKDPLYPSHAFLPWLVRLLYHFTAEKKDTVWVASFPRKSLVLKQESTALFILFSIHQNENNFQWNKTIFFFLFECLVGCQIKSQYVFWEFTCSPLFNFPVVNINLLVLQFATAVPFAPSTSDYCQKPSANG